MRRRLTMGAIGLVIAATTTGCPDGGPSQPPPTITSVIVTPAPAVAGGPLTIEIDATHPLGINEAHVVLITRTNGFLPEQHECAHATAVAAPGAATSSVLTLSCTLPARMPNGSDWSAHVAVTSNAGTIAIVDAPFTVTGGSDDNFGPAISALAAFPTSTTAGATFTFGLRLTDDNPPFGGIAAGFTTPGGQFVDSPIACTPGPIVPVDATSADVTLTCTVSANPVLASYRINVLATDDFAQVGNIAFDIAVV